MATAVSQFDRKTLSFPGNKLQQAQFLLRQVLPMGNVAKSLATIPPALAGMLGGPVPAPQTLKAALRGVITGLKLDETKHLGGSLDAPLSKAGTKPALYFVIHDTSSPTFDFGESFPPNINDASWKGNDLSPSVNKSNPVAHVFINRAGQSRTGHDYAKAFPATKFENSAHFGPQARGRFLHHEMFQPRLRNKKGVDQFAPDPGFPPAQYKRLALLYLCASIRGGEWLVPAFHCVLDEGIKDGHDDPQKFSLEDWGKALSELMGEIAGPQEATQEILWEAPALSAHPAFLDLAALYAVTDVPNPALKAVTLAHWAHASELGHSLLARSFMNFANLSYEENMEGLAESEFATTARSGEGHWAKFNSLRSFIQGYWHWLEQGSYRGWQQFTDDPAQFIRHALAADGQDDTATEATVALLPEAERLLAEPPRIQAIVEKTPELTEAPGPVVKTAGAYQPPEASRSLLQGIPLGDMKHVGDKYSERFNRWDAKPQGKSDPSRCRGLYQLPSGALFWESKMAVDADGATTPKVLAKSSGSQQNTSLMFKGNKHPVNAEIVPYFVLPAFDDPKRVKPGKPWEGSRDRFANDFGIELGALGVVIFGDKITGAIFADEGPAMKIGEASIRTHELIRRPPAPWIGDPADKDLLDASESKGVLYLVFPGTHFDIDAFGPGKQKQMAAAIQAAAMAEFEKLKTGEVPVIEGHRFDSTVADTGTSVDLENTTSADGSFVCVSSGDEEAEPAFEAFSADQKPKVDRALSTTHMSSRNGKTIDHIVIHYTTSRNIEGSISHFKTGTPRTSAHYIIGQDGELVQMVPDDKRAWHAGASDMNARSIGIEHVARNGDSITPQQSMKSIALIKWLMMTYDVPSANVIPHCCIHPTSCCGDLFKDFGGGRDLPCKQQKKALHDWLSAKGIT